MHEVDDIAYRALQGRHGTISAEHGVGRLKKPYLHMTRSPGEIALMRRLKQAMDPAHILNPGRILDDEKNGDTRCNAEPHSPP
jgi:FAD/FMN-containing dehydrogenase